MYTPKTASPLMLAVCALTSILFLWWFTGQAREIHATYDSISQQLEAQSTSVSTATVSNAAIHIPTWSLFQDGNIWSLTSKHRQLDTDHVPNLVAAPVAHTAGDIQIAKQIVPQLTGLFKAAATDGTPLMISSAYRSPNDQQEIYDFYLRAYGQQYVNSYVALPGTSEHQTGLAVDIASYSNDCAASANNCSLDYNAIRWLQKNATRFGFIQRYPTGKQSITGVASEAWHYRHVGVPLATFLFETGLTLDEFVEQAAPGYAQ